MIPPLKVRKTVSVQDFDFSSPSSAPVSLCGGADDGGTGIPLCPNVNPGSRFIGLTIGSGGGEEGSGGGICKTGLFVLEKRLEKKVRLDEEMLCAVKRRATHRRQNILDMSIPRVRLLWSWGILVNSQVVAAFSARGE